MAITTDLSTTIGQVRLLIGDDTEDVGVMPTGANYTDAQIAYLAAQVGGGIVATAAALCSNLARRWMTLPQSFSKDGLSINRGDMAAKYMQMAEGFYNEAMGGNFGTVTLDRRDGYSAYWQQGGSDLLRNIDTTYTEY
jgi:hypothetical protein